MVIMSSPCPAISLMSDEPLEVTLNETCRGSFFEFFPSQVPASDLSCSNDFCASDCASAALAANTTNNATAMRFVVMVIFLSLGKCLIEVKFVSFCASHAIPARVRLQQRLLSC